MTGAPAPEPREPMTVWRALRAIVAMVLGLIVLALAFTLPEDEVVPFERLGAQKSFGVYYFRDGKAINGKSGLEVRTGERLRFHYTTDVATHFALIKVGSSTTAEQLVPATGGTPSRLLPATQATLPERFELDRVPGVTTFLGIFCDPLFDVSTVLMKVGTGVSTDTKSLGLDAGCTVQALALKKTAWP